MSTLVIEESDPLCLSPTRAGDAVVTDSRDFDRAATLLLADLVATVNDAELTAPTPCDGWDVMALLTHMIVEHESFVAGAIVPAPVTADVRSAWRQSADEWLTFIRDADETVFVPRLHRDSPTDRVAAVHFVDMLVHGWDLAVATGRPTSVPADLLAAALPVARAFTADGSPLVGDGGVYAPSVPFSGADASIEALVALTGRDPAARRPRDPA